MRSAFVKSAMAGAILLLASGTARASALEVNVPFSFLVNNQTFPAGHYTVEQDTVAGPSVVLIRGMHAPLAAFVLTHAVNGHGPGPALQFEHRENRYQLSGIWESPVEGQSVVTQK
jgi:hypothetical protein